MESVDFVIKNGMVMVAGQLQLANLLITGEKITGIVNPDFSPEARDSIDAKGCVILPGVIDMHVHFRDPGLNSKEDFLTGTKGAAAGGVTCVLDMPNTKPPIYTVDNFRDKLDIVKAKAIVDFGLGAGVTRPENIEKLAAEGACVFKVFMFKEEKKVEGTELPHVPDLWAGEEDKLYDICKEVAKTGRMLYVHMDNFRLINYLMQQKIAAGKCKPIDYVDPIFDVGEDLDIARMLVLTKELGTRLYIVHTGAKEGMAYVKFAKSRGQEVVVETCPYRLFFTVEDVEKLGPYLSPLPQTKDVVQALWDAISDGTIDIVSSDHAPHTKEEKEKGWLNIYDSPAGCPGVQTLLPLMLTAVHERRISLSKMVELLCENPARKLGIFPKKGAIQVGSDADIVIVNQEKENTISANQLFTKVGWTVYEGWKTVGQPILTMVRGTVVMKNGEIVGNPGFGELVTPGP